MSHPHSYLRTLAALAAFTLVGLVGLATPALADDKPRVVASIHPLALLVAEVAGNEVSISTLVDSGQSPHSFQMRPSGRRSLAEADLIVWVGPSLELFLQRLMAQGALHEKALAVGPVAHGDGADGRHEHDESAELDHPEDETGHDHGHGEGAEDPHIWLDPASALDMAQTIAAALKQNKLIDEALIERNLRAFEARLANSDLSISQRLAEAKHASLFTYHEAFGQFAEHYGLEIAGSLTFSPEVQPGARRMSAILDQLGRAEAPCILTEPQFERQWWQGMSDGVDVTISTWDPLATGIEAEPSGYTQFMEGLAEAVLQCSAAPPQPAQH